MAGLAFLNEARRAKREQARKPYTVSRDTRRAEKRARQEIRDMISRAKAATPYGERGTAQIHSIKY